MADEEIKKMKISDLDSATSLDGINRTLVVQGSGGGAITKTTTVDNLGAYIVKDAQYSELTTANKKIIAAINEAATSGTEILCGTSAPTSSQGENHNLYIQYTVGVGGASDVVDALFVKLDGVWCAIDVGGGAESLDDLTDTDINSSTLGTTQVLMYDGGTGKWQNFYISLSGEGGSGKIHDVNASSPTNNDVLMWDGTYDDWENKPIVVGNDIDGAGNIKDIAIDELTLTDHQVLVYNLDDSVWENGTLCLGHTNMSSDFDDVVISQYVSNNELLIYDYSSDKWKNGVLFRDLYGTLSIGSTSVVITNTHSDITVSNASLEVFTDTFGVNPTDITVSGNNISLTFEAQSSTVNVKVRLWK